MYCCLAVEVPFLLGHASSALFPGSLRNNGKPPEHGNPIDRANSFRYNKKQKIAGKTGTYCNSGCLFYVQVHMGKFAARQHAPRAAGREDKSFLLTWRYERNRVP